MRVVAKLFGVVLLATACVPGALAADMVDATKPDRLVSVIQKLGYRAQLDKDDVGDPMIRSSVGGTDFAILFYGCDEKRHNRCDFLLFSVGYDLDPGVELDAMNAWNAKQLVGRAYRDDENDPWLEMPLVLKAGMSRKNFESAFEWWEASVAAFEDHIGL